MAEALVKLTRSLPTYGVHPTDIKDVNSKFVVSPNIMNHLKTVFRRELYYPNRNFIEKNVPTTPTFMGIPLIVNSEAMRDSFTLGITLQNGNSMGVQQIIPIFYTERGLSSGLTIVVKSRADMPSMFSENERRAIETLREMISEADYRRYLKYGFLIVSGQSGRVYQIPRSSSHVKVWSKGKKVEEICIGIKNSSIPLTDKVIALKTMVESSEEEFRKMGNVYKMSIAA